MLPIGRARVGLGYVTLATGLAMLGGGCGSQSSSARAQSPPPPSLSAPVRLEEDRPSANPAQVVTTDDYAFLKDRQPGRPLPSNPDRPALTSTDCSPAAVPGEKPQYYTMQRGDTLYAIARKFSVNPKDLLAANSFKDPNHLAVGTRVRIP